MKPHKFNKSGNRVESLWLRIRSKDSNGDIAMGVCYRPPNKDDEVDKVNWERSRDLYSLFLWETSDSQMSAGNTIQQWDNSSMGTKFSQKWQSSMALERLVWIYWNYGKNLALFFLLPVTTFSLFYNQKDQQLLLFPIKFLSEKSYALCWTLRCQIC